MSRIRLGWLTLVILVLSFYQSPAITDCRGASVDQWLGAHMQFGSILLLVFVIMLLAVVPVGLYGLRQVLHERGFWRNF